MSAVSRITLRGAKKASVRSRFTSAGGLGTGRVLVGAVGIVGWCLAVFDMPEAYINAHVEDRLFWS
jgi:hypothetical protein